MMFGTKWASVIVLIVLVVAVMACGPTAADRGASGARP